MTLLAAVVPAVGEGRDPLVAVHRRQIHRDPWPDFAAFDGAAYPLEARREAADLWRRRAQMEYASVAQFTRISAELADHDVPLPWHGALARIATDEVRHAQLCADLARALDPEGQAEAPFRAPPWPWPKRPASEAWADVRAWVATALLASSCLGETLSVPSYDALLAVCGDPVVRATLAQIRKDEPLHGTFGWEVVEALLAEDDGAARPAVQRALGSYLRGFEASMAAGTSLAALAGTSITFEEEPGNLGTLTNVQYAYVFYATLEEELLPRLAKIGLDGARALRETLPHPSLAQAREVGSGASSTSV